MAKEGRLHTRGEAPPPRTFEGEREQRNIFGVPVGRLALATIVPQMGCKSASGSSTIDGRRRLTFAIEVDDDFAPLPHGSLVILLLNRIGMQIENKVFVAAETKRHEGGDLKPPPHRVFGAPARAGRL